MDALGFILLSLRVLLCFRPDFKFRDHILDECIPDEPPKRLILKRDTQSHSFEEVSVDNWKLILVYQGKLSMQKMLIAYKLPWQ